MITTTSRRSFLKAGGACLALPFLESFAQAVPAPPPKRLVFLNLGYGFTEETFYPKNSGAFGKLPPGLEPLDRHKGDMTMIANLTNPGATDPHGGSTSYLTGANVRK